jgi:hypothetical protein
MSIIVGSFPLCPRKRTSERTCGMSAKCQSRHNCSNRTATNDIAIRSSQEGRDSDILSSRKRGGKATRLELRKRVLQMPPLARSLATQPLHKRGHIIATAPGTSPVIEQPK